MGTAQGRTNVIGMGTADMDYHCAPEIKAAFKPIYEQNTYNYKFKSDDYYESLVSFFAKKYDLKIEKSWLSNVPGTIGAVHIALNRFSKPGDYILMQSPYFTPLKNAIETSGRNFITNPLKLVDSHFEIDFKDFEEKIKQFKPRIFLMVNPQNPTGRVFTQQELERMVDICYENNVLIISDEVHFMITRNGHRHIPILAVSDKAREIAIQIFSFSKGFNIMDLPHAMVLIANKKLNSEWQKYIIPFSFDYTTNIYAVTAVTTIAEGKADGWKKELDAYLDRNLNYFISEVKKRNLPIKPIKPEAGFILWIDCRKSGLNLDKIDQEFLNKANISLNNGLEHGKDGKGFVRMNFAVTFATMQKVIDNLTKMFA